MIFFFFKSAPSYAQTNYKGKEGVISNLVFYSQPTITVISGHLERKRTMSLLQMHVHNKKIVVVNRDLAHNRLIVMLWYHSSEFHQTSCIPLMQAKAWCRCMTVWAFAMTQLLHPAKSSVMKGHIGLLIVTLHCALSPPASPADFAVGIEWNILNEIARSQWVRKSKARLGTTLTWAHMYKEQVAPIVTFSF